MAAVSNEKAQSARCGWAYLDGAGLTLAEAQGFEPWNPCGLPVFKTGAIDHSAKLPRARILAGWRTGPQHAAESAAGGVEGRRPVVATGP